MDLEISRDPPPHWFTVSAVSALACGVMLVALGWVAGRGGEVLGGCQQFGDFGCGGYVAMGLCAAPLGAMGGAVIGGIIAARMVKRGSDCGAKVWKRSLGIAVLSLGVTASTLLGVAAAVL